MERMEARVLQCATELVEFPINPTTAAGMARIIQCEAKFERSPLEWSTIQLEQPSVLGLETPRRLAEESQGLR